MDDIRENKLQLSSKKSKLFLPIDCVQLDTSISSDTHSDDNDSRSHLENVHTLTEASEAASSHDLVVGSAVQYLNTGQYGILKWIGTLSGGTRATYAGVEMVRQLNFYFIYLLILLQEDDVDNLAGMDGSWSGVKYFSCKPNRGKFVVLNSLKPDQRLKENALPGNVYMHSYLLLKFCPLLLIIQRNLLRLTVKQIMPIIAIMELPILLIISNLLMQIHTSL